jgi:hypothetical protein
MPAVDMRAATPVVAFTVARSAVAAGSAAEQSTVVADTAEAGSTVVVATADTGKVLRPKLEKAGRYRCQPFSLPICSFANLRD